MWGCKYLPFWVFLWQFKDKIKSSAPIVLLKICSGIFLEKFWALIISSEKLQFHAAHPSLNVCNRRHHLKSRDTVSFHRRGRGGKHCWRRLSSRSGVLPGSVPWSGRQPPHLTGEAAGSYADIPRPGDTTLPANRCSSSWETESSKSYSYDAGSDMLQCTGSEIYRQQQQQQQQQQQRIIRLLHCYYNNICINTTRCTWGSRMTWYTRLRNLQTTTTTTTTPNNNNKQQQKNNNTGTSPHQIGITTKGKAGAVSYTHLTLPTNREV